MSGIGLNLFDVTDTVDRLMAKQYIQYFQLQTKKNAEDIQVTSYGSMRALFETFQSQMNKVKSAFNAIAYAATSSDTSIINGSVTSNNIGTGNHSIVVAQLAQAQRITGNQGQTSRTGSLSISETLTFTNTTNNSIHYSITIEASDSLEKIRDKINNASDNIGVSAAIVSSTNGTGDTEYHLVLTSDSGEDNAISISGDTGNYFDFQETVEAKNAEFTFDGLSQVRSSNTINDVMDGLTFTLSKVGSATLTINETGEDVTGKISAAITDMLASYNQIVTFLDANSYVTSKDDKTKQSTTLISTPFNFIKQRLQTAVNAVVSGAGGLQNLRDVGVVLSPAKEITGQYDIDRTVTSTGSLMIDTKTYEKYNGQTALQYLVKNDFKSLKAFFSDEENGLFANINNIVDEDILPSDSSGMIYAAEQDAIKRKGYTDKAIIAETDRLDTVKAGLIDQFSRLNGIISYYQNISNALEKQYDYLNNLIKSGK